MIELKTSETDSTCHNNLLILKKKELIGAFFSAVKHLCNFPPVCLHSGRIVNTQNMWTEADGVCLSCFVSYSHITKSDRPAPQQVDAAFINIGTPIRFCLNDNEESGL